MKDKKIVVAWLWSRHEGLVPFGTPILLGLDPQRYRIVCIYLMKNSEEPSFFEKKGFKVFYISRKKFFRVFNFWAIWKLSRILKRQKVDILHSHRHQASIYGTIAAKLAGVPVVICHVHGLKRSESPRRRFINWIVLRWATKIIAVSQAVRDDILRCNPVVQPEQVVCIGNSIDCDRFLHVQVSETQAKQKAGLRPDSFVFGTVGRLVPTKGHTYLISAFAKVKQQIPSAQLVLIGDGRLKNQLEEQAYKMKLSGSTHFLGQRTDIPELLKAMDVFVFPSIAEGMPFAVLEAIAASVPCIATAVGGIPEIITHNQTGFLVPLKDEKALTEAMINVAKKPEREINQIVNRARKLVRTSYTREQVREKLEHLYETELQSSGGLGG